MELEVDPDKPVHENRAHLGQDLGLTREVFSLDTLCPLHLSKIVQSSHCSKHELEVLPEVVVDVLDILDHQLGIASILDVDVLNAGFLWS